MMMLNFSLFLVPVFPQAFLALVRCHFVSLSFLSTWHRILLVYPLISGTLNKLFQVLEIRIHFCLNSRILIHGFHLFELQPRPFPVSGI